jgi:hypothetical protein
VDTPLNLPRDPEDRPAEPNGDPTSTIHSAATHVAVE